MSETKMTGKMRRAITRADEDEVRRRVARATGGTDYPQAVLWFNDRATHLAGWGCGLGTRAFQDVLATVGIFPGASGWEIEVRRALPAPWQWHPIGVVSVVLCRSFNDVAQHQWIASACAAGADGARWYVFAGPGGSKHLAKNDAASLAEARERAEDECWARGLFGAVEDAPPVDAPRDPAHEATVADLEAQIAGLVARLAVMAKERNAARVDETDAGHSIAQLEALLARVTAERNEARLNLVDARAHCASWRHRAERAEAILAGVRDSIPAEFAKVAS